MRTGTRRIGALAVAVGVLATGCSSASPSRTGTPAGHASFGAAGTVELAAFKSCPELLRDLRAATERQVGPYGIGSGVGRGGAFGNNGGPLPPDARSAAEAAPGTPPGAKAPGGEASQPGAAAPQPGYSRTNVHEAGADEPDLVKTDGRRIVTVVDGRLRVIDTATRRVTGTLDLAGEYGPDLPAPPLPTGQLDLLLHGDRALVLSQWSPLWRAPVRPDAGDSQPGPPGPRDYGARMTLIDLAGTPRVVGRLNVDGAHVDARQVGSVARVVVRSSPRFTFPTPGPGLPGPAAARENRKVVRAAPAQAWLPRYEIEQDGRRRSASVPCERMSRPRTYTGTSMLSVLTVDLAGTLGSGDPVTVVADGDTVYGTGRSLYVTSNPRLWITPDPLPGPRRPAQPDQPDLPAPRPRDAGATEIHRFDIAGTGPPRYAASGRVPGRLLNQYALSEYADRLRVATTRDALDPATAGGGTAQSAVYVLTQRGDRLTVEGQVKGLGKGERIYAVRFLGPLGYVVTFRQTDPLYVLDLRDHAKPRVTGELKITGYSAYLHPAGEGRLIGVGQEATEQGRVLGTQVALFDVRDLAKPRRLAGHHVASSSSEAEFDPHAFLYWPQTGLTVVPLRRHTDPGAANQALVLKVGNDKVERVGAVRHPEPEPPAGTVIGHDPQIRRALVIGNTLWTVSSSGVQATAVDTLKKIAWVPLS